MMKTLGVTGVTAILIVAGWPFGARSDTPHLQDVDREREFAAAAKRGDENAVRKALDEDSTLAHAVDVQGMTALDWAATRKQREAEQLTASVTCGFAAEGRRAACNFAR